ncbi:MAG: outer membrane beta-barrel protein [Gemmatimonadales bacterium]
MIRQVYRVALVAGLVCTAVPLSAQRAQPTSNGFWFGATLGPGWVRVGCDICDADRGWGPSGALRLGGRVSRKVLIGAEATGWLGGEGSGAQEVNERLWGVSAAAYWYPNPRRPLYWKGGIGLLSYRNEDDANTFTSSAVGVQLGAGWDLRVGRNWFLTPSLNLFIASLASELNVNGAEIQDSANLSLVQVALAVTRY